MNLNEINWFNNIGNSSDALFQIPTIKVNKQKCYSSINSTKWENFILYAINRLSWYLQTHHKEEAKEWNSIVRVSKNRFEDTKDYIVHKANIKEISNSVIIDVKGIVSMFLVESFFKNKLGDGVPIQFKALMDIYCWTYSVRLGRANTKE